MPASYTIKVSDFTTIPGPRRRISGDNSAEEFFEDYVLPIFTEHKKANYIIDFSGTWGYGPSFTSQLGILIVDKLGKDAISRVSGLATDDPEVVERFKRQMEDYANEKH